MGQPDWSRIPFEKMPAWKKQEILEEAQKKVEAALKCPVCGKVCKNTLGLKSHQRSHGGG